MNIATGALEKVGGILKATVPSIDEEIAFASDRGLECRRKWWAEGDLTDRNLKGLRRCDSGEENELRNGALFKFLFR
jgi:hypothetical protein